MTMTSEPTATPAPPAVPVAGVEVSSLRDIDQVVELGTTWVRRNALQWFKIEPGWGHGTGGYGIAGYHLYMRWGCKRLIARGAPDWAFAPLRCGHSKQDWIICSLQDQ
jgi:hypothetical protein